MKLSLADGVLSFCLKFGEHRRKLNKRMIDDSLSCLSILGKTGLKHLKSQNCVFVSFLADYLFSKTLASEVILIYVLVYIMEHRFSNIVCRISGISMTVMQLYTIILHVHMIAIV